MMKNHYQTTTLVATSLLLFLATPSVDRRQIVPDNSLPNNSIVTPNGSPLYIFSRFFEGKAIEHLIGPGVTAEYFKVVGS